MTSTIFKENFEANVALQFYEASVIEIVIPGKPIPYIAVRKGKKGKWYNPRHLEKQKVRWLARNQYKEKPILGPVRIEYDFRMLIPISWPKWKKEIAKEGLFFHVTKPDGDNLMKFYNDCIKDLIIGDDSHIVSSTEVKQYDSKPRTIIKIVPLHHA